MAIELDVVSNSQAARRDLGELRKAVDNISASANNLAGSLKTAAVSMAGFVVSSSAIFGYAKLSDSVANLETRLRVATDSQESFNAALADSKQIAFKTKQDLGSIASLYSKIFRASAGIDIRQSEIARVTELTAKSIALSGSNASESAAAITQFSQALSRGILQGDELRSIGENASYLRDEIARGLGKSIGEVLKMGEAGELTTEKITKALLKQGDAIDKKFSQVRMTYGMAFTSLGVALQSLFSSVSDSVIADSALGRLPQTIDEMAGAIMRFATNFDMYVIRMEGRVITFTANVYTAFAGVFDNVRKLFTIDTKVNLPAIPEYRTTFSSASTVDTAADTAKKTTAVFRELYEEIASESGWLGRTNRVFSEWLHNVIAEAPKEISSAVNRITSTLQSVKLKLPTSDIDLRPLREFAALRFEGARDSLSGFMQTLSGSSVNPDLFAFIPDTSKLLSIVKEFATTANDWFFWLYDQVIGHSWIPDLVEGTIEWLKKLGATPIMLIKDFVGVASRLIMGLATLNPFGVIISASKVFIAVAAAVAGLGLLFRNANVDNFSFDESRKRLFEFISDARKEISETSSGGIDSIKLDFSGGLLAALKSGMNSVSDAISKSWTYQMVRQALGMKATAPLQWDSENYKHSLQLDTSSEVGRGPMRSSKVRVVGHDLLNALPEKMQLPAIAAVTSMFALAIVGATQAGMVRTALLSLLTTVMGIITVKTVDDREIARVSTAITRSIVNGFRDGLKLFIGNGGIFGDSALGTLSLIAKTMLLFASGRAFLGRVAQGLVTAPARGAVAANTRFEAFMADRSSRRQERELQRAPVAAANLVAQSAHNLARAQQIMNSVTPATGALGARWAQNNLASAQQADTVARRQAAALTASIPAMQANLARLQTTSTALNTQLREAAANMRNGVLNHAAGIGGVLGSIGGFNVGNDYARKNNMSDRAQLAFSIGGAAFGQAIGSALSVAAARIGMLIGGSLLAAVLSPLGLAFVAGAAAIALALNWDTLKPVLDGAVASLKTVLDSASKVLLKNMEELGKVFGDAFVEAFESAFPGIAASLQAFSKRRNSDAIQSKDIDARNEMIAAKNDPLLRNGRSVEELDAQIAVLQRRIEKRYANATPFFESPRATGTLQQELAAGNDGKGFETSLLSLGDSVRELRDWVAELPSRFASDFSMITSVIGKDLLTIDPVKRATGGWISGPGGPRDDKIPAMLSNGEFVVNAKESAKNRSLLDAINSGRVMSYFADGTPPARSQDEYKRIAKNLARNSGIDPVIFNSMIIEESRYNADAYSPVGAAGLGQLMPLTAKELGLKVSAAAIEWQKAIELMRAGNAKLKYADAAKILPPPSLDTLKAEGDERLVPEKNLDASARLLASLQTKFEDISKALAAYNGGPGGVNWDGPKAYAASILQRASKDGSDTAPSKSPIKVIGDSTKDILSRVLKDPIGELKKMFEGLKTAYSGNGPTVSTQDGHEYGPPAPSSLLFNGISSSSTVADMLNALNVNLSSLGMTSLDLNKAASLSSEELAELASSLEQVYDNLKTSGNNSLPAQVRLWALSNNKRLTKEVEKSVRAINSGFDAVVGSKKLSQISYDNGASAASGIRNGLEQGLSGLLKGKITPKEFGVQLMDNITGSIIDNLTKGLVNGLFDNIKDGQLGSGLKALMSSVFALGYEPDALFKSKSAPSLDSKLFGGEPAKPETAKTQAASVDGEQPKDTPQTAVQDVPRDGVVAGFFKGIWEAATKVLSSIFGTDGIFASLLQRLFTTAPGDSASPIGGLLSGAGNLLSGFFGNTVAAASGGFISGAGTATSDSIPAMLSNGEFVVNARQTKRFAPVLSAINEGRFGRFAEGGAVDGVSGGGLSYGSFFQPAYPTIAPTLINSVTSSVDMVSESLDGTFVGLKQLSSSMSTYTQSSSSIIAAGFGQMSGGLTSMGLLVNAGFASVGVLIAASQAQGKVDWFGAALAVAGIVASAGMAGAFKSPPALGSGIRVPAGGGIKYAEGGPVWGLGTATSDSIAAKLSNGEFVINARQTAKHRGLLEAINANRIPHFSTGGPVGVVGTQDTITEMTSNTANRSEATFHINITGDVSRQTRSEIQAMIPNIARGVNGYNTEKGNRQR